MLISKRWLCNSDAQMSELLSPWESLKLHVKKVKIFKERDANRRAEFREKIRQISKENIVYIDETGVDSYLYREYGRAARGQKIYAKISEKKYKRTSIVAGKIDKKIIAPLQYDGTMDSKLFEFWMGNMLLKNIKKGTVIVMDNAAFHRKRELEKLSEGAKCSILFLPPYSPDLNPIEQFWSWLKRKLRETLENFSTLNDAISSAFSS